MATEILAAGVPIVTVSQRLSHARVSTSVERVRIRSQGEIARLPKPWPRY
jgi:hypothetical protein